MRREGAVLEDWIGEQIRRCHRHRQARGLERAAELGDDAVALERSCIDRHEIVVVEIDSPHAELGKLVHGENRIQQRADELAEGIAPAIADGPQSERELIRRCRLQSVHGIGLENKRTRHGITIC